MAGTDRKIELLDLVEKLLVILTLTTKQVGQNPLLDRFILEASMVLLEEGETLLAAHLI